MGRAGRAVADYQDLRAEIIRLRRDGLPVDRAELAGGYSVSQRAVTTMRAEVDQVLVAAEASDGANSRTVANFDGDRLRNLRRGGADGTGLWLTQEQLGRLANKSRAGIGHLERGNRKPTIRTLCAIADALGVNPSVLLSEENSHGETFPVTQPAGGL